MKRQPAIARATIDSIRHPQALEASPNHKPKTASIIAQFLGAEGFNEYVAGLVEYYHLHRSGMTDNQRGKFERVQIEFGQIMKGMSESQRLIVGKFLHMKNKMAFDTGLKIGLTAYAVETEAVRVKGGAA